MLKEIGDILPDVSDDCRFNMIQHLAPFYKKIVDDCPRCKGNGETTRYGKVKLCKCRVSFGIVLEMLKSNFPRRYLRITDQEFFERRVVEINIRNNDKVGKPFDFSVRTMMPFLKEKLRMVHNSVSLLLTGNNESGKTYAALYMLADFIKYGYSGHYIRFRQYMNLVNSAYTSPEDKLYLRQIKDVKFLVIDELGKEVGKIDHAICELEDLIKYRHDCLSCTVLITNLDFSDLIESYGQHIRSSFHRNYQVLVFHPDASFRKKTTIV